MYKNKIGWQKYEDLLEQQINSPLIDMVAQAILKPMSANVEAEYLNEYEVEQEEAYQQHESTEMGSVFAGMPEDLSNEIQMISNFDCWLGHTNFNITKSVKERLENVRGVEVLKICSRYRFFIGIGRMFDFSEVRKEIEESFL
tara:strand:+ start:1169 stop:1597 length:429 start_codon:yes stop_codon:yes gene_type:complete